MPFQRGLFARRQDADPAPPGPAGHVNFACDDCARAGAAISIAVNPTTMVAMIRLLFRLLALFSLSVAVIFAVLDSARSIAASAPVMTPLRTSWLGVSPETLAAAQDRISRTIDPLAWDPVMVRILDLPGFAVFAVLAFLLFAIGHRRERRVNRLPA